MNWDKPHLLPSQQLTILKIEEFWTFVVWTKSTFLLKIRTRLLKIAHTPQLATSARSIVACFTTPFQRDPRQNGVSPVEVDGQYCRELAVCAAGGYDLHISVPQIGDDLVHSLGSARGLKKDVLRRTPATTPVLPDTVGPVHL